VADDTCVMEMLQRILDKVAGLEARLDSLSMAGFTGTINAQNVTVANGGVTFESDVEAVSVGSVANGGVSFESDVSEVAILNPGKVDISGDIESLTTA
jgi:hypothetical protein